MTIRRRRALIGIFVLILFSVALRWPVQAAPPAQPPLDPHLQAPLLFDQEAPVPGTLNEATPQLVFAFTCIEGKVASVYVETVSGDLAVEAVIAGPDGAPFAYGSLASSNPNITVAEAFVLPTNGPCTLTLNRTGQTTGQFELRLLSGFARLTKWDAFDGVSSPLRMSWSPYTSLTLDVRPVEDETLRIQVLKDNLLGYALPDEVDLIWSDVYIQADFRIEGAPSYFEYGFTLRTDSEVDSFYTITFSSDGDFSIYYFDVEWTPIQEWTVSPRIDGTDQQPRAGVLLRGDTFRLYFNDQFVAEVSDPNGFADDGTIGLAAATGEGQFDPLTIYADNVVITTPFEGAAIASLPFGGSDAKPTPSGGLAGLLGATKVPTPSVFIPPTPPPQATATPGPIQGDTLVNWASADPNTIINELRGYGLIPTGGAVQLNVPSSYGDTSASGFSHYPLGQGRAFADFVLSFDARLVMTGPESGCGVYFRHSEAGENSAMVMADGSALLAQWDGSGTIDQGSFFDYHNAVIPGQGASNRVTVVAIQDVIVMYINGQLIARLDATTQAGDVALEVYVAEDDAGQTVETYCQLNNIWLWAF